MDHHAATDAVALCLAVGGSLAVVAAAALAARSLVQRPPWPIAAPEGPVAGFAAILAGFRARAGPPSALLQVFRL